MIPKRNQDIREAMKKAKVPYWFIGEQLGVHANTVMSMMNKELSEETRKAILAVINYAKGEY